MKNLFILLIIFLVTLNSCNLLFGPKYKEPASTVDCPPDFENSLNNIVTGKIDKDNVNPNEVMLQLSRIKTNELPDKTDNINIFLHPIDRNGNFINDLNIKDYWCKVIDSSFGNEKIINDYTFKEVNRNKPLAIAIIMDHSGSMGERRVEIVQEQVFNFLQQDITSDDEIYLVKYDNNLENVPYPGQNYLNEFREGFVNGFSYFGGGTAFYDAVGKGIELLQNSMSDQRILIALTDGLENSSRKYTNAEMLVDLANQNNVSLTTIGFGDNIDKPMLADTLALRTGGIYHQICRSEDFATVFFDIYNRYKNYYVISYNTARHFGEHKILVKLCLKNNEISAANNYIVPLDSDSLIVIDNIFFEYNSAKLKSRESKKSIDRIQMIMEKYPSMEIDVYGHTDSIGSDKFNYDLSERRAKSVYQELIVRGISQTRMGYKGFGENIPIADNGTKEGRAINRRVEFKIQKFDKNNLIKRKEPVYRPPNKTMVSK